MFWKTLGRPLGQDQAGLDRTGETEDIVLIPGDISWAMKLSQAKPDLDSIANFRKKVLIRES